MKLAIFLLKNRQECQFDGYTVYPGVGKTPNWKLLETPNSSFFSESPYPRLCKMSIGNVKGILGCNRPLQSQPWGQKWLFWSILCRIFRFGHIFFISKDFGHRKLVFWPFSVSKCFWLFFLVFSWFLRNFKHLALATHIVWKIWVIQWWPTAFRAL